MSWLAGRCDAGRGGRVDDLPDGTQATSSAEAALAAVCDQLEALRRIAPLDGATLKTLYAIESKAREALSADVTARDYRIVESRCGWEVLDPSGCWAARYSQNHPDPEGGAEAEAARLNAGGDEDDLHVRAIELICERDRLQAWGATWRDHAQEYERDVRRFLHNRTMDEERAVAELREAFGLGGEA